MSVSSVRGSEVRSITGRYSPAIERPAADVFAAKGLLEAVLGETPPLDEALSRAAALHPLLPDHSFEGRPLG